MDYREFLSKKTDIGAPDGFEPIEVPAFLFQFQRHLTEWAIRRGQAAIFADCVAPETVISGPDGAERVDVLADRGRPLRVWSLTPDRRIIAAWASSPWVNGYASLYRFTFASGHSITATMGHRFLTESGWKRGSDLVVGERLGVSVPSPLASNSALGRLWSPEDDRRCSRTIQGSLGHCSTGHHPCGGQPLQAEGSVATLVPSRDDALGHSRLSSRTGDRDGRQERIRRHRSIGHPSIGRSVVQAETIGGGEKFPLASSGRTSIAESNHTWLPVRGDTTLAMQGIGSRPSGEQRYGADLSEPCEVSFDTLVTVQYIRDGAFYDMEVPGTACYLADNIWSHNCGLGKTPMQLVWADNVVRKTGGKVLIVTPLAVCHQTEREARKFGIDASVSRDGTLRDRITITNYERLHYFKQEDFTGAVADESGAIKAFNGKRRKQVVRFFGKLPYRLLCTATPSPNDFIELGTQSECLGIMTQSDMLGYFFRETKDMRHTIFKEGDFWNDTKYTFKPHSEQPFWRWVTSWARSVRHPSDIGFDDAGFILPELRYHQHIVENTYIPPGELFPREAVTLKEQANERKATVRERAERVAELVNSDKSAIVWCHLNEEGVELAKIIPDAVEVAGRHSDEYKEATLNDFAMGNIRVLVSKPKIACWGMNYQHCGHMTFFPTYSFEQFYQGVRRCWRFGRTEPVDVDVISSPGEAHVIRGLDKKMQQAERMYESLITHMRDSLAMFSEDGHTKECVLPEWLVGRADNEAEYVPTPDITRLITGVKCDAVACDSSRASGPQNGHGETIKIPAWLGK